MSSTINEYQVQFLFSKCITFGIRIESNVYYLLLLQSISFAGAIHPGNGPAALVILGYIAKHFPTRNHSNPKVNNTPNVYPHTSMCNGEKGGKGRFGGRKSILREDLRSLGRLLRNEEMKQAEV